MQLGTCQVPAWPSACHHHSTLTEGISVPISQESKLRFREGSSDVPSQLRPSSMQIHSSAITEARFGTQQ